jgi:NAD(P)H-dependent FMN reductase
MTVLLLNAGLGAARGSSAALCARMGVLLDARGASHEQLVLASTNTPRTLAAIDGAERLVIATGTYWDGWSSHLQRFLEEASESECGDVWLGKPAAVVVSAHQVGARGVLSRLQAVLNTLGCTIPPLGGVVVDRSAELLRPHAAAEIADELWGVPDLAVLVDNLLLTPRLAGCARWSTDARRFREPWLD